MTLYQFIKYEQGELTLSQFMKYEQGELTLSQIVKYEQGELTLSLFHPAGSLQTAARSSSPDSFCDKKTFILFKTLSQVTQANQWQSQDLQEDYNPWTRIVYLYV